MKTMEKRLEKLECVRQVGEMVVVRGSDGENLYWQKTPMGSRFIKTLTGVSTNDLL